MNVKKTDYMIIQRRELVNEVHTYMEVGEYKFKKVKKFLYLWTHITQQNEIQTEIWARIQAGHISIDKIRY